MPYPRWLAKVNKRLFNQREIRRGKRPVVVHVGRVSGATYMTPTDSYPTDEGYVLVVRYGPRSDWVRNTLAAGAADLVVDGFTHSLTAPRLVDRDEALSSLREGLDPGKDFYKAENYLLMDLAR